MLEVLNVNYCILFFPIEKWRQYNVIGRILYTATASCVRLECEVRLLHTFKMPGLSAKHYIIILYIKWPPTFSTVYLNLFL